jgi:hypothetical protein
MKTIEEAEKDLQELLNDNLKTIAYQEEIDHIFPHPTPCS